MNKTETRHPGVPFLGQENANNVALHLVEQLPIPVPKQNGPQYQVVSFASEEDCRFFYPQRTLEWHREFNGAIQRAFQERGIDVQPITITPWDYHQWRKLTHRKQDTSEMRRKFADAQMHFDCPFPARIV